MKSVILFVLVMCLSTALTAATVNHIRFGFLAPTGPATGSFGGFAHGTLVDDIVEINGSLDMFYRNYTDERTISYHTSNAGNPVESMQRMADLTTSYWPLQMNTRFIIPLDSDVKPFFGGGLGFGLLREAAYIAATDTHHEVKSTKYYNGFNWNVSGGARYRLSRHTAIYGELFYNHGVMKRNRKLTEVGLTWDQIDMSGMGLRLGLELPSF